MSSSNMNAAVHTRTSVHRWLPARRAEFPAVSTRVVGMGRVTDVLTVKFEDWWSCFLLRKCGKGRAHYGSVHDVRGQVFAKRPCVVVPDRLVHLRQRKDDVAGQPGHRTQ